MKESILYSIRSSKPQIRNLLVSGITDSWSKLDESISSFALPLKLLMHNIRRRDVIIVISLTVILSITSCGDKNNGQNIINPVNALDVNLFTDSVSFVKLQMTSDCIIKEVSKILFTDSMYIVLDNSKSNNSIYFFDNSGRFINKINRPGRGPGEYVNISNIDYCEQNRNIYIYDVSTCDILEFSIVGEYISTIPTGGLVGYDFKVINPDLFILYSPDVTNYLDDMKVPNGLLLIDREKGYIRNIQALPEDTEIISAFDSGWLTEYDGKISLISATNREIYTLKENELTLTWKFSFPEVLFKDFLPPEKPIYKAYPIESNRFIFYYLLFAESSQVYPVLFDKETGSGFVSDSLINEHHRRTTIFWGGTKDKFFSAIDPSLLSEQERKNICAILGTEIHIGENPIITIYHLKKSND